MYAAMERIGETASVSPSASIRHSFMPLSLAQRLTRSTLLSLPTPLHKEPRCWPQQHIDMLFRRLINSSGCAMVSAPEVNANTGVDSSCSFSTNIGLPATES